MHKKPRSLFSITVLLILASLQQSLAQETVKNIGFLGRGYDIVCGNPRPLDNQPIDEGIVSPVFDMTIYRTGRTTADKRRLVPDAADVVECGACLSTFQTDTIYDNKTYQESINQQMDIKVGGFLGLFTYRASKSYQKTIYETTIKKNVLIDAITFCVVYCAELRIPVSDNIPDNLFDENFADAVKNLPAIVNDSATTTAYSLFFQRFGTHYISSLKAGSMYWMRSTFTEYNYQKLFFESKTKGKSLDIMANQLLIDSLKNYSLSINNSNTNSKTIYQNFSENVESIAKYSIGVPPSSDVPADWLQQSSTWPMPISMKLMPVATLFNLNMFPTDPNIDSKRLSMEQFYRSGGYCRYLKDTNPDDDIDCEPEKIRPSIGQPPGVFGGIYNVGKMTYIPNTPNAFTGQWDCPEGQSKFPLSSSTLLEKNSIFFCMSDAWNYTSDSDPEGAFGGMFSVTSRVSCKQPLDYTYVEAISNVVNNSGTGCPPGFSYITVGFYISATGFTKSNRWFSCEVIFACYRHIKGASLGGFYLEPSVDNIDVSRIWNNPATGVLSCPTNYVARSLLSNRSNAFELESVPFNSYFCLKSKY